MKLRNKLWVYSKSILITLLFSSVLLFSKDENLVNVILFFSWLGAIIGIIILFIPESDMKDGRTYPKRSKFVDDNTSNILHVISIGVFVYTGHYWLAIATFFSHIGFIKWKKYMKED